MIMVTAALSLQSGKNDHQSPFVQTVGDHLDWSAADWLNASLADTNNWNYTPLFLMNHGMYVERESVATMNETNTTVNSSRFFFDRLTVEEFDAIRNGTFPDFGEIYLMDYENGTKWNAPCPDPGHSHY